MRLCAFALNNSPADERQRDISLFIKRDQIGAGLKPCYGFPLVPHRIAKTHPHDFVLYAQDPELADMLRASGVEARY